MFVVFIPGKRKSDMPWGADFFLKAVMEHSENEIIPHYGFNNLGFGSSESIYENADIIHLHNLSHTALDRRRGRIFGWRSRIKEYVSYSGDRPIFVGGIRGFMGLKSGLKWLKYFDAIHVGNDELLEKVKPHNKEVFINYPGIDVNLFKPAKIRNHGFNVLWVGDTSKQIKNSNLLERLSFPVKIASKENYIAHDKMPEFYSQGHVLICLSDKEGFCRPIIEAMACGLTVISTKTGIAPYALDSEWLIDDPKTRNGKAQLDNKLSYLCENPDALKLVGQDNREKALEFSWKNSISRLDENWKRLLSTW